MFAKKILYFDMDNTFVNFASGIAQLSEEELVEYEGRYDEVEGIFSKMIPIAGAIEAIKEIHASGKYEIYILSTAPWANPSAWSDKVKWIQQYLPEIGYKRLILSHNKQLNIGDFLVDDRTANGAGEFNGELLQIFSEEYPNWVSIKEALL